MIENVFDAIFLVYFIIGSTIRAISVRRISNWWRKKEDVSEDRDNGHDKELMFVSSLGMVILPFTYLFTPLLEFADYSLPAWVGWIGTAVFAAALWLLWRSHADLGENFSPELKIRDEHSLVTQGVYRHIRHPMYASHILWAVAQALLLQNWMAGPAFLVMSLPLYIVRIPREEKMMEDEFGEEYRKYAERTGQVVPRIGK